VQKFVTYKRRFLPGVAFFLFCPLVPAQTSDDLAAQSQQAKQLMGEGRFEEAIPIYRRLMAAVPGNPGLILNLGLAEEMAGHFDDAIPHFEQVLKQQPDNVPALSSLSMCYLQQNQPRSAMPILERLVKAQPDNPNNLGMLAGAYMALDRLSQAAATYRKLLTLDQSDPKAWYGLGKSYEGLATKTFTELSKLDPQSPYVAALLADTRLQRKQYRSAYFFYREAMNKLPELPGVHAGMAKVYQDTGHADWATTEQAHEKNPADCNAQTQECAFLKGNFTAAAKAIDRSPASLFWSTRAYTALAIQSFDHLGTLPDSVEIHALKAQILHGHGQDAEAAAEWRAALALAPNDPRLETELASALFVAHRYDEAMPLLTKLHASQPNAPDLNFMLGESLWRTQQPDKALPFLNSALQQDPQMLPAHAALGMVLALLNRNAEAVPHLEKALSLDDDGSLHYSLGKAYQAAGNRAKAQETMQQSQQIRQKNQEINDELSKEAEIAAPKP
jgi:tetratricopeptide (TPR) repeat protein